MTLKTSYVYIMASKPYGTLYIGVTSDLEGRIYEHKFQAMGFTKQYKVNKLVYYELFFDIMQAIAYEKALKRWRRDWKIEKNNPHWIDLYPDLIKGTFDVNSLPLLKN